MVGVRKSSTERLLSQERSLGSRGLKRAHIPPCSEPSAAAFQRTPSGARKNGIKNSDWCDSPSPLRPGALPAGFGSPTCVRGMCESNIQQQPPPTQPAPPPSPPPPAAHACLASRHVAARIRLDNQRRSTFRLAPPQGPQFLSTAALQSAAVKPRSESSRTGRKGECETAAETNPHSSQQRSEVNQRHGSGSAAHKSLWGPGVYGGGRPDANASGLKRFPPNVMGFKT